MNASASSPWKSSCSARSINDGSTEEVSGEYSAPKIMPATTDARTSTSSATPVRGCTSRTRGRSFSSRANSARTRSPSPG